MKEKDVDKKDEPKKDEVLDAETSQEVHQEEEQVCETEDKEEASEQKSNIIYLHDRKKTKGSQQDKEGELATQTEEGEEKSLDKAEDKDGSLDATEGNKEEKREDGEQATKKAKVIKLNSSSWKNSLFGRFEEVGEVLPSNRKALMIFGSALLVLALILFLSRGIWKTAHYGGEVEKYTVGRFVMEVNEVSKKGETPFPKGKRIQLYGPIVRMNETTVYMKSEDKLVEIQLSSKTRKNTDFSKFILGKSYKLETTIVDAGGTDDVLYLNEGEFISEDLPEEEKVEEKQ